LIKQIKICEIDEFIPNKQQKSFQELLRLLSNEFKIPVIRDTRLVRGLDYYNGTAFEIKCTDPIVQNILG
jgi:histidyl-tRNA synthetase